MREKNPDIQALIEGHQLMVMEKFIRDDEKFTELYEEAQTTDVKLKIIVASQTSKFKMYKLLEDFKASQKHQHMHQEKGDLAERIVNKVLAEEYKEKK